MYILLAVKIGLDSESRIVFQYCYLSLAPYRTNWAWSFSDPARSAGKLTQLPSMRTALSYVRITFDCVSTPREFLADVSGKYSRTGAVKLLITRRRASRLKLLRRYRFARNYSLSPAGSATWGCGSSPRSKDDSTLAPRLLLLSSMSPLAMPASRWGNPGRPGRADGGTRPRAFSSDRRAMYPVAVSRYCAGH